MPRRFYPRRRSTQGFTLLELLVVVVLIGVLFAIAAPGWNSFMSGQRLSQTSSQLAQIIRSTQSQARTTKTLRFVLMDTTSDPPRVAIVPAAPNTTTPTPITLATNNAMWQTLGNGNISSRTIRLVTTNTTGPDTRQYIAFDGNGNLAFPTTTTTAGGRTFLFQIQVRLQSNANSRRCVIGENLIGGLRDASGSTNCP